MVSGVKDDKLKKELLKNIKNKKISDDTDLTPKRRSTFFGFGTKKESKSVDEPINNANDEFSCGVCKKPGHLQCSQCKKV